MAQKSREVAVMCWFPTGKAEPFPVSMKFRDDEGEIVSIKDIHLKKIETVFQGKEYHCESLIGDRKCSFKLIFFKDDYRWMITI